MVIFTVGRVRNGDIRPIVVSPVYVEHSWAVGLVKHHPDPVVIEAMIGHRVNFACFLKQIMYWMYNRLQFNNTYVDVCVYIVRTKTHRHTHIQTYLLRKGRLVISSFAAITCSHIMHIKWVHAVYVYYYHDWKRTFRNQEINQIGCI